MTEKKHEYPPGMIAIPCVDWVYTRFLLAYVQLWRPPGTRTGFESGLTTIEAKRNHLVHQFLRDPRSAWIFFLDSDMTPPQNTIQQLLETQRDIVSGLYMSRNPPYLTCAGYLGGEPLIEFGGQDPVKEVDWVGAGCLLIRRHVFENISPDPERPDPWFRANAEGIAEDTGFCARARGAGFKVYCDTSLWVGHLGVSEIDLEYALTWNETENIRGAVKDACGQRRARQIG